jgi:hypothetical protein
MTCARSNLFLSPRPILTSGTRAENRFAPYPRPALAGPVYRFPNPRTLFRIKAMVLTFS